MKINNLLEKTEIPPGLIKGYNIEIYSGKEAVLNGNTEIIDLSENTVVIRVNEHKIAFLGKNIRISCYTNDCIKINGLFDTISFEQGGKI